MITLILVVCLAGHCHDEPVPLDPGLSCMIQGEVAAQAWLTEHPKWELRAWRCRYGEPAQKA